MKKLAAALALSLLPLAFAAQAEITTTDVVGRKVTVPDVPKRVVLGSSIVRRCVAGAGAACPCPR